MRIVAGAARGRRLVVPKGTDIRPTSDRVREAIFNSLHSAGLVVDRTFVDLFAGSGGLGLEALSRGAAHVTFVDTNPAALEAINTNGVTLSLRRNCATKSSTVRNDTPRSMARSLAS